MLPAWDHDQLKLLNNHSSAKTLNCYAPGPPASQDSNTQVPWINTLAMSDDDFMQASDEEYDFEYEDEEEEDSGDVDIENKYYNAKQTKTSDPDEAVGEFLGIPALEPEKGEWGFKALKQAIKLEFKLQRYEKVRRLQAARRLAI